MADIFFDLLAQSQGSIPTVQPLLPSLFAPAPPLVSEPAFLLTENQPDTAQAAALPAALRAPFTDELFPLKLHETRDERAELASSAEVLLPAELLAAETLPGTLPPRSFRRLLSVPRGPQTSGTAAQSAAKAPLTHPDTSPVPRTLQALDTQDGPTEPTTTEQTGQAAMPARPTPLAPAPENGPSLNLAHTLPTSLLPAETTHSTVQPAERIASLDPTHTTSLGSADPTRSDDLTLPTLLRPAALPSASQQISPSTSRAMPAETRTPTGADGEQTFQGEASNSPAFNAQSLSQLSQEQSRTLFAWLAPSPLRSLSRASVQPSLPAKRSTSSQPAHVERTIQDRGPIPQTLQPEPVRHMEAPPQPAPAAWPEQTPGLSQSTAREFFASQSTAPIQVNAAQSEPETARPAVQTRSEPLPEQQMARLRPEAATTSEEELASPPVRVHIGRVVARGVSTPSTPPAATPRKLPRPALSLQEYLKQRERGNR